MTAAAYAQIPDVFIYGPKAEMYRARARSVRSVTVPAAVFSLPSHGLNPLEPMTFAVTGTSILGQAQPTLPTGIDAVTTYYPLPLGGNLFQVATVIGGSPVTVSDAGTGVFGVEIDPSFKLDRLLEGTARGVIDEHLTNYDPPILVNPQTGKYDLVLVRLNARLTARDAVSVIGLANPEVLAATVAALDKDLEHDWAALTRWMAGKPINVRPGDQTSGIIEGAAKSAYDRPSQGWERACL